MIHSEEDDLDNLNLDIQQDLVGEISKYIREYSKKRNLHKRHKKKKKQILNEAIDKVVEFIFGISTDALESNMRWLDLDDLAG